MSKPEPIVPVAVRRAGLVDIPAVVRLIEPPPASTAPPSPLGAPGVDWEQAQRAMRLMMAHHALEEGQVWVGERVDGALLAACVWLPADAAVQPPHEGLGGVLTRELGTHPPELPELPEAFEAACPEGPHWKVVVVSGPDTAWEPALANGLLSPGLESVDEEEATAVAVVFSRDHLTALSLLGFDRPSEVRLAPGADVWVMTRNSRTAPSD